MVEVKKQPVSSLGLSLFLPQSLVYPLFLYHSSVLFCFFPLLLFSESCPCLSLSSTSMLWIHLGERRILLVCWSCHYSYPNSLSLPLLTVQNGLKGLHPEVSLNFFSFSFLCCYAFLYGYASSPTVSILFIQNYVHSVPIPLPPFSISEGERLGSICS